MINRLNRTRDVIMYSRQFIKGRTIDVGAGSAKYSGLIKEYASEYVAFDTTPGGKIDVVGDVLNMPFDEGSFDTVISSQVLEHVKRPWVMVAEISRILKTDGVCLLTAPFMAPYHADPEDYFRYTQEGMKSLFQDDFEIVECQPYGKTFMVFFEYVKQVYFSPYKKTRRGLWSERFLRYLEKVCFYLDDFVRNDQVYANVYIVARKK